MRVGHTQIVEAKLSTTLSAEELKSQLTEAGRKEAVGLKIGDRMQVTLNGGQAFDISPSGPQSQLISRSKITTWTWFVTPKVKGTQFLILSLDCIISLDGKDGTRNVNTLKHQIEVEVGWPDSASEWFELTKKWFENLSWLWASLLIPMGVYFVAWWRRWRHAEKPRDTD
jgi:hypothetical protein